MSKINGDATTNLVQAEQYSKEGLEKRKKDGTFKKIMGGVADGVLTTAAAVGSSLPGGGGIATIANILKKGSGSELGGGDEQMSKMWEMQRENQAFNMQYLQLQTQLQSDNRRFSTMSNLMKARHDTAKSAINNMHV